eukprot:3685791-Pleurochrysis_carterae.AAC.1
MREEEILRRGQHANERNEWSETSEKRQLESAKPGRSGPTLRFQGIRYNEHTQRGEGDCNTGLVSACAPTVCVCASSECHGCKKGSRTSGCFASRRRIGWKSRTARRRACHAPARVAPPCIAGLCGACVGQARRSRAGASRATRGLRTRALW